MKTDIYQIITVRIIQLLHAGTAPWHRPWKGPQHAPQNFVSRKLYRGINAFLLHSAGYASPFWLTFKQVNAAKGRVKKGEHAFPVVFWKLFEDDEALERRQVPLLRYYSVFNLAQCEGIETDPATVPVLDFEPIAQCERVVANMPRPPLIQHGSSRACYAPASDTVSVPESNLFESAPAYYGTLFHELIHCTGHKSRLGRKEILEPNRFGSDPYSREELVAEMGAAFLCGHCAIDNVCIEQSASYLKSWLERLKDDRRLIIHAAAQAQKACDFILDTQFESQVEKPYAPDDVLALKDQALAAPAIKTLKIEEDGDPFLGKIRPKIRLKGLWLERAGFPPGRRAQIMNLAPGILTLRLDERSSSDPS